MWNPLAEQQHALSRLQVQGDHLPRVLVPCFLCHDGLYMLLMTKVLIMVKVPCARQLTRDEKSNCYIRGSGEKGEDGRAQAGPSMANMVPAGLALPPSLINHSVHP